MDGVIYHGNSLLPGVKEFVNWCHKEGKHFVFLTNNSMPSPKELQQKMKRLGVEVHLIHYSSNLGDTRRELFYFRTCYCKVITNFNIDISTNLVF
jgi:hypothetical protein